MSTEKSTTTTGADSSAAPTAALPAADPAPTSPAEEGRQRYIIRQYHLDNVQDEPTLFKSSISAYLDSVYGDTSPGNRIICSSPGGEPNTLEIYHCRTPMHAVAMLAVINAAEDDIQQGLGEVAEQAPPEQVLTRHQREQQTEE